MVSGTISLLCPRCFSPFPHGTGSLSVSHEYLALPDGPGGFTQDFTCPALLRMAPGTSIHTDKGLSPATACISIHFSFELMSHNGGPTTPQRPEPLRFGLFRVRSPLLAESLLFSLPGGNKMFQFPPFASVIHLRMPGLQPGGLSHSEIRGSRDICSLPRLIAAYHVLRRL